MELFVFHLRVGARVGLRLLASVLAGLFAAYYLLRPEFFVMLGDHIFVRSTRLSRGLLLALLLLPAAGLMASRITLGLAGWIRHLPAAASRHRRLAALAVFVSLAPLIAVLFGLAFLAGGKNGPLEALAGSIGAAACAACLSVLVLPVRRPRWGDLLGLAAAVLAGTGDLRLAAAGLAAAGAVDAISGPFLGPPLRTRRLSTGSSPLLFTVLQQARAFGPRLVLPLVPAALVLGLVGLLRVNNPLPSRAAAAAARFGGTAAVASLLAAAAAISARRLPPWAWGRSLPLSSLRRAAADAFFLGALALPAALAAALLDPRSAAATAAALLYLAFRAAGALRPAADSPRSPIFPFAVEGLMAAALSALWPWTAALLVPAAAIAARAAARRERALKAGHWLELRFAAAGDPFSGRAS
jgi:hypothetical protein